jgi:hypothetical protein
MSDAATLQALRIYLLVIIVLVLCGLELELLMLNHVNTPLQLLPVGLVGGDIAGVFWSLISPNGTSLRILKGVLMACTIIGALGIAIHSAFYVSDKWNKAHGRRGLEREVPPLAPAAMLPLGLMGLACTFRHPLLEEEFGRNYQSITRF